MHRRVGRLHRSWLGLDSCGVVELLKLLACLLPVEAVGGSRVLNMGFLVLMEVLRVFMFVKDLRFGDVEDIDSFLEIKS